MKIGTAVALAWPVFRERLLRPSSFVFRKSRDHARARGSSVTLAKNTRPYASTRCRAKHNDKYRTRT
jgi:hypothetical protein